ncbi:iron uptake system protein EfeO [Nocardia sp. alder85J]|uniref:iron uptake system protein EfeO n=1 Tax=Nocardia sp. alder85J TaxID=2862949 RepID=UPI001CD7547C|nr:iron uptake system protein EfeO [Nocardia sp. alder85J]MCX4092955.1 peptidase M75 family protein [Nocardia sp. alder85J]
MKPKFSRRRCLVAGVLVSTPLALVACTSKSDSGSGAIAVTSTDSECHLSAATASTGQVVFNVTNNGSKVTEFYMYAKNNRVLGEVENIGPGVTGKLVVDVSDPGEYDTACKPGMVGNGIRQGLTVSGSQKAKSDVPADVEQANARYLDYVRGQLDGLVAQTTTFVAAVKSGDLNAARNQFGLTRTFYERVEPVAESFADLDPAIDMRWDDTEDGKQPFTGFHRIERFLWPPAPARVGDKGDDITKSDLDNTKTDTKDAISAEADTLLKNVTALRDEVKKSEFTFEHQSFVKGPQALVDEIARTKVGGEEDRYSHTDLWDFAANIDGSETLIADLQPMISAKNPTLMDKITSQFQAVRDGINQYRQGDGYLAYTAVTAPQRKDLSDKIDALSASLSQVPDLVLGQ